MRFYEEIWAVGEGTFAGQALVGGEGSYISITYSKVPGVSSNTTVTTTTRVEIPLDEEFFLDFVYSFAHSYHVLLKAKEKHLYAIQGNLI